MAFIGIGGYYHLHRGDIVLNPTTGQETNDEIQFKVFLSPSEVEITDQIEVNIGVNPQETPSCGGTALDTNNCIPLSYSCCNFPC